MRRDPDFVRAHRQDDVHRLALQADKFADHDMPWVVQQVDGWQRARTKLPRWALTDGILYPGHLAMEQCSSEEAARYKADVVLRRFLAGGGYDTDTRQVDGRDTTLIDLTGGMGVDHAFLAPLFNRSFFVERQEELCRLARHNLPLLHLHHTTVVEGDAMEAIDELPQADVLFIDPARRDSHGKRTWGIADCTPNILPMLRKMLEKAPTVVLKLSPMLDWHLAAEEVTAAGGRVAELHIVEVDRECKELLLVVVNPTEDKGEEEMLLRCVHNGRTTDIGSAERQGMAAMVGDEEELLHSAFLYEPGAAIMKSGCFAMLSRRYALRAVGTNSHLFTGQTAVEDFPGRMFRILRVFTMNRRECAVALQGITQANITTRNFPMTTAQLRKKLRLAEGGQHYLFATTFKGKPWLLLVKKEGFPK